MRTTAKTLLALAAASVAACGPAPETSFPLTATSGAADRRLGALVWDAAVRAPALPLTAGGGYPSFSIGAVAADPGGGAHVLLGLRLYRRWGNDEVASSTLLYRRLHADGRVETRAAPDLAEPIIGTRLLGDCGQPDTFVVAFGGVLASGQILVLHVWGDGKWRRYEYMRSDRPDTAVPTDWFAGNGQFRCLGPDRILLQHGGRLLHWKDGGWKEIEGLPNGLRLGPMENGRLRILWVEDGELRTDVMDYDGVRENRVVATPVADAVLGSRFSSSGNLEHFMVDLDWQGGVRTLRYARARFKKEFDGSASPMLPFGHSYRAIRSRTAGGTEFQAAYLGVPGDMLGLWGPTQKVTCDNACKLADDEHAAVVSGEGCAACVERQVEGFSWDLLPDGSGLVQGVLDRRPDGFRVYVKKLSFPLGESSLALQDTPPGPFPGDPGTPPDPPDPPTSGPKVTVSGRILEFGRADHSGTKVTMQGTGDWNVDERQEVHSGTDGRFRFETVWAGSWHVQGGPVDRVLTIADTGDLDLGTFQTGARQSNDASFSPGAESREDSEFHVLYQVDGGILRRHAYALGNTATLGTGVTDWRLGDGWVAWNEGDCASSCRLMGAFTEANAIRLGDGVRVEWLRPMLDGFVFPDGLPGTTTLRSWKRFRRGTSTPTAWYTAAEAFPGVGAQCRGTILWENHPTSGIFGPTRVDSCDYRATGTRNTDMPAGLPLPSSLQWMSAGAIWGFGALAGGCTSGPPWTGECELWTKGWNTNVDWSGRNATRVRFLASVREMYAALVVLDDGPALLRGLLGYEPWIPARRISVSSTLLPGEQPLYFGGTGDPLVYWRGPEGLWMKPWLDAEPPVLVVPGAVRVQPWRAPVGGMYRPTLLVHTSRSSTGTLCEAGCGLQVLELGSTTARAVFADGEANGREAPGSNGAFWRDGVPWPDCPGTECSMIVRRDANGRDEPITVGELWPDRRSTYLPFPHERVWLIDHASGQPRPAQFAD